MAFIKKYKFLISVLVGVLIGIIFKEKAIILKPFGTIFVNLIFSVIVPLVFIIILKNIVTNDNSKKFKKLAIIAFIVAFATLFITGIMTELSLNIYSPFQKITVSEADTSLEKINLFESIVNMFTVNDFGELFSKSNILSLILVTVIIGISINSLENATKLKIKNILDVVYKIIQKYLNIIMLYAPIGISAYLASLIGEYGKIFISQYLGFIIMYLVLGILNIIIFHTLYLFLAGGLKLVKSYYKNIFKIIITALSTQSSVVTMPTNIKALENMGIDKDVVGICTPIFTLVNMQGNVIQNTMKIFLLINLFNIHFSSYSFIVFILIAILAGSITAGIPGGGVISNTILVSALNVPSYALPILITIEWMLDAFATVFNVLSDTSTIPLVSKLYNRKDGKNANLRREKFSRKKL